jgi:nucleotide-binding universal stress UspA family protein
VIVLEGSPHDAVVLDQAFDQATRHAEPDLHVITVTPEPDADLGNLKFWLAAMVLDALDGFRASRRADWRTRTHVRVGVPEHEILALAEEVTADLIVIGRFHDEYDAIADRVVEAAACPTLVVGLPRPVAEAPFCEACAAVRERTDGDRWFCVQHGSGDRHISVLVQVPHSEGAMTR